jgi:hypothetical protein
MRSSDGREPGPYTPAAPRPLRTVPAGAPAADDVQGAAVRPLRSDSPAHDEQGGEGQRPAAGVPLLDATPPEDPGPERRRAALIVRDALRATDTTHEVAARILGWKVSRFEKALRGEIALDWFRLVRLVKDRRTVGVARVISAQLSTLADHATPAFHLTQREHVVIAIREVGAWAAKVSQGDSGPEIERELLSVIECCNRALVDIRAASNTKANP